MTTLTIGKSTFDDVENYYEAVVVKSGNGASIKCLKKFIGQTAIVVIIKKK
jgi:putative transposon-encoded protein